MQKIIAMSVNPEKHKDVLNVLEEINSKGMSASFVMRQLLLDYADNDYKFKPAKQDLV